MSPGGQVASALVACTALGLSAKYIGVIGGRRARPHPVGEPSVHRNQSRSCAEARGLSESVRLYRDRPLHRGTDHLLEPLRPPDARPIRHHRGADYLWTAAAYRWTRYRRGGARRGHRAQPRDSVTVDVDTIYHGFDKVLANVDYLVASAEFPSNWTGRSDPFRALETIWRRVPHAGCHHDAGWEWGAGVYRGRLLLFPRFPGGLRGHHGRGRRVPWGPFAMLSCRACRCWTRWNFPTPWLL